MDLGKKEGRSPSITRSVTIDPPYPLERELFLILEWHDDPPIPRPVNGSIPLLAGFRCSVTY